MFSMHRDLIIGIVEYKTKSMKDHFIIVVLRGVRWNSSAISINIAYIPTDPEA